MDCGVGKSEPYPLVVGRQSVSLVAPGQQLHLFLVAGHNYLAVSWEEKPILGLDYPDNCFNPPLSLLGICQQPESWERD